jgi:DNA invertase Pin-like site-specific DNA recombinase
MIRQRIKAGLKRAVAQGVKLGRPKIDGATERKVRKQLAKGVGILKVARSLARPIASQTSLAESQHCDFAFVGKLFMCGPGGGDFLVSNFHPDPIPGNLA